MLVNYKDFYKVLLESRAAEEAKKRGLKHVGYGKYADKSGKVVAISKDDKLVPVNKKEPAHSKVAPHKVAPVQPAAKSSVVHTPIHKNKELRAVNSNHAPAFREDTGIPDQQFHAHNKAFSLTGHDFLFPPKLISTAKVPRKYLTILERMIGTQLNSKTKKWQYFSSRQGGAGTTPAQAGELMTLASTTMNDKDAAEFYKTIADHVSKAKKTGIVDESWVKAAAQQRGAIWRRLKKQYGPNVQILNGAWDTKDDVESLGLTNYKQNKGYSTDIYFKLRLPNGKIKLDEVSLKKSTNVNFLNSRTSTFKHWDKNLPKEVDSLVYATQQRNALKQMGQKYGKLLDKMYRTNADKEFTAVMKAKGFKSIGDVLQLYQKKRGGNRETDKALYYGMLALAKRGVGGAKQFIQSVSHKRNTFINRTVAEVSKNQKIKNGVMEAIRNEFPLKAVSEKEESMAIGAYSLDTTTLKEIFGTSDYNEIKEHLVTKAGPPPFIGYQASTKSEIIPIAKIRIRENGNGYGGDFRFDMELLTKFANRLKDANVKVYGMKKEPAAVRKKKI